METPDDREEIARRILTGVRVFIRTTSEEKELWKLKVSLRIISSKYIYCNIMPGNDSNSTLTVEITPKFLGIDLCMRIAGTLKATPLHLTLDVP